MSKQVDSRVVQMQFDNKKFEQGVQTTLNSITKLDQTLNSLNSISLKGFEKLGNLAGAVNLDSLGNAAEAVSYRMSSMGVVGARVLSNLTDAAIKTAKHLSDITIGQIMTGGKNRAMNIANAKFQLEGLGVAWDKVKDDIDYGVKDTAYGLDAAAQAASQLVASNVQLGEEMQFSLRAISGVAAMTNRSYEETASIFTTVAGNGRLMGDQLMQLSSRGLNAAAALGKQLGKSEAEIREMVSKGQIDFKTFAKAMDEAFGEHAKEANKTFNGALSNMKAALSRIGAEFYTPGLEYARDVFNAITGAVNTLKKSLADYGIFDGVSKIMKTLSENAVKFFESISDEKSMNAFIGGPLKMLHGAIGSIQTLLNRGVHTEVLKSIAEGLKYVLTMVKAVFSGLREGFPVEIIGSITSFTDRLRENRKEFDGNSNTYMRIRKIARGIGTALNLVTTAISNIIKLTKPFAGTVVGKLIEILKFLGDIGDKLHKFSSEKLNTDFYTKWASKIDEIKSKFTDLQSAVDLSLIRIDAKFKEKFGKTIPELIQSVKDKFVEIFNKNDGNEAKAGIDWFGALELLIKGVTNALLVLIEVVGTFYQALTGGVNVFEILSQGAEGFINKVGAIIAWFSGKDIDLDLSGIAPEMQEFLKDSRDVFKNLIQIAKDALAAIYPVIHNIMQILKTLTFKDIVGAGAAAGGVGLLTVIINKLVQYKNKIAMLLNFFGITKGNTQGSIIEIGAALKTVLGSASSALTEFTNNLRGAERLKSIAISIGILAASLLVLSSIDEEKMTTGLIGVSVLLGELIGTLKILETAMGGSTNSRIFTLSVLLIAIGLSVAMLASSLKKLAKLDSDGLKRAFLVVAVLLIEIGAAISLLSKYVEKLPKVAGTIIGIAFAIRILASALNTIGKLDGSQLFGGLLGITVLLGEIIGFMLAFQKFKLEDTLAKVAVPLLAFAVALNLLIPPLAALAVIGAAGQLGATLAAFGILLGEIALFSAIMGEVKPGEFLKLSASLIVFAIALNLMLIPLAALAVIGAAGQLDSALIGFAILLGEIALFSAIMTALNVGGFLALSASLIVFALALNLMIAPLITLATIDTAKALLGLGALMTELALFSVVMSAIGGGGALAVLSAGLIVFAIAMNLLIVPLTALASMQNLNQALIGFAALVVILAVMAGFAAALSGLAGAILAVSAAFLLIGAAVALVGVGIAGLGTGIYMIVAAFRLLIQTVSEFADSFVDLSIKAALGVVAFLLTLSNATPQLIEGLGNIIIALCKAIQASTLTIVKTIGDLLYELLAYLAGIAPQLTDKLLELVFGILHGLLTGLSEKVPVLARDLYNFCMEILDETVKLLKQTPMDLFDIFFGGGFDKDKNSEKKLGTFFKELFNKNKDNDEVKEAGEKTGEQIVDSTAEEISSKESQDKVDNSLTSLLDGGASSILNNDSIPNAMNSLSNDALDGFEDPLNIVGGESLEMKNIAGFTEDGFLNNLNPDKFYDAGSLDMSQYMQGMKDEGGIASPSKEAMKIAEYVDEGFALGMEKSSYSEKASEDKVSSLLESFANAGNLMKNFKMPSLSQALQSVFDSESLLDDTYEPTIAPVLDTSNLSRGFTSLNSMFSASRSLALAGEAAYLQDSGRALSMEIQNGNSKSMNQNFGALGSKLDRLGDAILSRQIVLDSGELVGGLANPMDRTLGVRAIRAQRGGRR